MGAKDIRKQYEEFLNELSETLTIDDIIYILGSKVIKEDIKKLQIKFKDTNTHQGVVGNLSHYEIIKV